MNFNRPVRAVLWRALISSGILATSLFAVQNAPEHSSAQKQGENANKDNATKPPIDGIRDNSFLIEEAYNQEPGVVQHIFTGLLSGTGDDRALDFSFTQEWPVFSQTHQLSYTLPYAFLDSDTAEHDSGLGDVLLNYRYQLSDDAGAWPAFSPRVSLVFPSGDEDRGFGDGVLGYQINLPFSKTLSDHVYANLNLGLTYLPDVGFEFSNGRRPHERDLLHFNIGASVIYAVNDSLHLMLEAAGNFEQGLEEYSTFEGGRRRVQRPRSNDVVISPGVRWATNLPDLQLVYGLAFPIGVTDDAMDYGVFLYLSIEHPFITGAMD
jgi:hypothetical protein